ncbi:hypothetical protein VaNZ11_001863, partial [Volvox africanus]
MAQQRRMPAHGPTAPVLGEGTDNSSITAEDVCLRDQRAAGLRFMKAFGVDVANDELADALSEATKAEVEYGGVPLGNGATLQQLQSHVQQLLQGQGGLAHSFQLMQQQITLVEQQSQQQMGLLEQQSQQQMRLLEQLMQQQMELQRQMGLLQRQMGLLQGQMGLLQRQMGQVQQQLKEILQQQQHGLSSQQQQGTQQEQGIQQPPQEQQQSVLLPLPQQQQGIQQPPSSSSSNRD